MDKIKIKDILTKYPIVLSQEHFDKLVQDLKSLVDSAVEEYLQEKLSDYEVLSLEYKIIKSMLEE